MTATTRRLCYDTSVSCESAARIARRCPERSCAASPPMGPFFIWNGKESNVTSAAFGLPIGGVALVLLPAVRCSSGEILRSRKDCALIWRKWRRPNLSGAAGEGSPALVRIPRQGCHPREGGILGGTNLRRAKIGLLLNLGTRVSYFDAGAP
jgi:hypothetical protein